MYRTFFYEAGYNGVQCRREEEHRTGQFSRCGRVPPHDSSNSPAVGGAVHLSAKATSKNIMVGFSSRNTFSIAKSFDEESSQKVLGDPRSSTYP